MQRYFPLNLPVAFDAARAVFVHVDPGYETATALRSWGAAHREFWKALGEHSREIARIKRAILKGGVRLLKEVCGDVQRGLRRMIELEERARRQGSAGEG